MYFCRDLAGRRTACFFSRQDAEIYCRYMRQLGYDFTVIVNCEGPIAR